MANRRSSLEGLHAVARRGHAIAAFFEHAAGPWGVVPPAACGSAQTGCDPGRSALHTGHTACEPAAE
jgi:hypothetical protein